jgi:hypothetical protein
MLFLKDVDLVGDGGSDNVIPQRYDHSFTPAVDMQLGINIPDMTSYGIHADKAGPGNHFITVPFYEVLQNLCLSFREIVF